MTRRLSLLVVGMVFGGVLWGGLVSASGQAPQQTQVLRYVEKTTKSGYVDNDPEDISVGDVITSHGILRQNGEQAGTIAIQGTVTLRSSSSSGEVMLSAIAKLADGHLALAGRLFFLPKAQTFQMAITGGTGAYRTARGHGVFEQVSGGRTKVTLYVLL